MMIIYAGDVGSGKTYCGLKYALTQKRTFFDNLERAMFRTQQEFKTIYSNTDLGNLQQFSYKRWYQPSEFCAAWCGTLIVDECDMYFDSRKFAKLDDTAREFVKERRKHHCRMVMTTQHIRQLDVIFRRLATEVRVVRRLSVPLLGYIFPWSVRPDVICTHCGKVRTDDGIGDQNTKFRKFLGFGTLFFWISYPPAIIGEQETVSAEDAQNDDEKRKETKAKGHGFHLFDIRIAKMYDTSSRISQDVQQIRNEKAKKRFVHYPQNGHTTDLVQKRKDVATNKRNSVHYY